MQKGRSRTCSAAAAARSGGRQRRRHLGAALHEPAARPGQRRNAVHDFGTAHSTWDCRLKLALSASLRMLGPARLGRAVLTTDASSIAVAAI